MKMRGQGRKIKGLIKKNDGRYEAYSTVFTRTCRILSRQRWGQLHERIVVFAQNPMGGMVGRLGRSWSWETVPIPPALPQIMYEFYNSYGARKRRGRGVPIIACIKLRCGKPSSDPGLHKGV